MKVKLKGKEQTSDDWKQLAVSQFKYQTGLVSTRTKIPSVDILQQPPLKILAHKLSLASQTASNNRTQRIDLPPREQEILKQSMQQFKKMLTPRDTLFQPRRSVFNRYNYENYHNYEYKNPYKPKRFPIQDKMQKPIKNNPNHGSSKNLEIVFCEHRYKDFVERSNSQFRQFYQTSRQFPIVKSPKRKSKTKMQRHQSQSKMYSTTSILTKKRKTTLSNHLQQFNTLQKLSEYMQRQHKLNEKFLLHSTGDSSRTVLLDILTHRFQFLKKMKKKGRDLVFKIILGEQALRPLFKINIQDYIKFIQLFVSRDADCSVTSMFIFKFLFREDRQISMESALESLDLIQNTLSKHKIVEDRLYQIFQKYSKPQQIYEAIKTNEYLQNAFMDLLTSQK